MKNFGHLAFILVAVSFLVKDILWLRCLSIIASLSRITFNYFVPATPLWLIIYWQFAFISINLFQIGRILRQRVGIRFTQEEKDFHESMFKSFAPFEFIKLVRTGEWKLAEKNVALLTEGSPVDSVLLIYNGIVSIEIAGREAAQLKDGDFIGEMSFVKGGLATASARTIEKTKYLEWPKANLKRFLERNPTTRFAMKSIISLDLTKKLERANV